jgi:hypothetical protein
MLSDDHIRAETFNMIGEGANRALMMGDNNCLRNNKGHVMSDWMEVRDQARSYTALLGALLGSSHHCAKLSTPEQLHKEAKS